MIDDSPKIAADLRHKSLVELMHSAFKESIVVHVLNHKTELPNDARRDLDVAINSVVRMPQFPQPARYSTGSASEGFYHRLIGKFRATSQRGLSRLVCVSGDTVCGRQGLPLQQGYGR